MRKDQLHISHLLRKPVLGDIIRARRSSDPLFFAAA